MVKIDRPGHAVGREIRIGRIEDNRAVDFARVDLYAQGVARSERIVLFDTG